LFTGRIADVMIYAGDVENAEQLDWDRTRQVLAALETTNRYPDFRLDEAPTENVEYAARKHLYLELDGLLHSPRWCMTVESTKWAINALIEFEGYLHYLGTHWSPDDPGLKRAGVEADMLVVSRALRATGRRLIDKESAGVRGWLPFDVWVLAWPEYLDNWVVPEELKGKLERIDAIYYYDITTVFHLCEVTPSHELWLYEYRAVAKEEFAGDDKVAEELDNWIRGIPVEREEWHSYVHCHEVEAFVEKNAPGTVYHLGHMGVDLDDVEGVTEEDKRHNILDEGVREYLNGGMPL